MVGVRRLVVALCLAVPPPAVEAQAPAEGVAVGAPSRFARLVPAEALEEQAAEQFSALKRSAEREHTRARADDPQRRRLARIADRLIPYAPRFNPRAKSWQWEVELIASPQINAFCLPGGKIVFYTAILDKLELSDAEVAAVMGHEMAHALREHAREQIAKRLITRIGASLIGELLGGGILTDIASAGGSLLTLTFSRSDETEADLVGLELAARAGFDPAAGVSLWRKMSAATRGAPPSWLSTHPSSTARIAEIERQLPRVRPLYEAARGG